MIMLNHIPSICLQGAVLFSNVCFRVWPSWCPASPAQIRAPIRSSLGTLTSVYL